MCLASLQQDILYRTIKLAKVFQHVEDFMTLHVYQKFDGRRRSIFYSKYAAWYQVIEDMADFIIDRSAESHLLTSI